jgi:flagellar biosynthetic protein FliR
VPDIYKFSEYEIIAFFLVLVRSSAFIVSWPVFGVPSVPNQLKILFALAIAFLLFPILDRSLVGANFDSYSIIGLTIKEAFVGVILGYLGRMFFFAIGIAGEIASASIGLSSAQLFNPSLGGQSTSIEQLKVILGSLFYLGIQGHHLFLSGLVDSFRLSPLGDLSFSFNGFIQMGTLVQQVMEIGVKMSAPVMVSILFMNVAMAVIGRAVPQINVMITSLPVNILAGLFVLIISLPLFVWQLDGLLEFTGIRMYELLKTF